MCTSGCDYGLLIDNYRQNVIIQFFEFTKSLETTHSPVYVWNNGEGLGRTKEN